MKTKSVEKLNIICITRITLMQMKKIAQALVNNGYEIVPEKLGTKLPAVRDWLNGKYSADDINENNGIAIKTGAVVAIDFDILDESLCNHMKSFFESIIPIAPQRVGKAPKTMLICKAAADEVITKQSSAKFGELKCQVEILGRGQKFTAYNIHKDTKQPYKWVDLFGGLEVIDFDTLPTITQAQIDSIIDEFETECEKRGLEKLTKRSTSHTVAGEGNKDKCGLTIEEARRYLDGVDLSDFETWTRVGLAIAHEFDGSDEGLELYDELSSNANGYDGYEAIVEKYNNCKNVNNITMRTFIHMFNENKNMRMNMIRKSSNIDELMGMLEALSCQHNKDKSDYAKVAIARGRELLANLTNEAYYKALDLEYVFDPSILENLNEFMVASIFEKEYENALMFVNDQGYWNEWSGSRWKGIPEHEVMNKVVSTIKALVNDIKTYCEKLKADAKGFATTLQNNKSDKFASTQLAKILKDIEKYDRFINNISNRKTMANVFEIAKTSPKLAKNFRDLDKDPSIFGVANGAIKLKEDGYEFIESCPSSLITLNAPTKFNPEADCPLWIQTVNEICDYDEQKVEAIKRMLGYGLTGKPVEQKIFMWYGEGANGKSTILTVLTDILGKRQEGGHGSTVHASTFVTSNVGSNSGAAREDLLRLAGVRLAYVSELESHSVLKESFVKSITGGESIPARGVYARHTVEVKPMFSAFVATNHKPIIKGDDHGIWRRIVFLKFGVNFDNHPTYKKDPRRVEKLMKEADGILNWLLEGYVAYRKEGLLITDEMKEDAQAYRESMDLIADWMGESCELGNDKFATLNQLWISWKNYAMNSGDLKYIDGKKKLNTILETKFKKRKTSKGWGFDGISMKIVGDDEF